MNNKKEKPICYVCKKEKKPYIVILDNSIFSMMQHEHAREDGEICQRCDQYHAMTGELKEPTNEEFEIARKACEFSRVMSKWWNKDKKLGGDYEYDGGYLPDTIEEDKREWEGTVAIERWYREKFVKETNKK